MEQFKDIWADSRPSRKRKSPGDDDISFSLDDLNQDLLERVLSWLPTSTFFRLSSSICKRWKSVASSPSFKLACSQIPSRDPWFLMVDRNLNNSVIFDSSDNHWRNLSSQHSNRESMPVASSGGLVCLRHRDGNFVVSNPVTGSSRELPPVDPLLENQSLHAIVMNTFLKCHSSHYKLVLVYGEFPRLLFRVYDSSVDRWEDEVLFSREADESIELDCEDISNDDGDVYFLSKAGNVVVTNMQRSPSKQYSSVITCKDGEETIYFLSSSGTVVACNLSRRIFSEYPRILPVFSEYSIDVVECRGEMLVVVLSEFLESASLRIWRFDSENGCWHQVSAMPPRMSHEYYSKKVDINCVGAGDRIFICANSTEHFSYVVCDLMTNEWIDLPKCCENGEALELMSAFSFEPRIEASV